MKWIKATERLPKDGAEIFLKYTNGYSVEKLYGWYNDGTISCCGKHFGALYHTFTEDMFGLIEWLDEEPFPTPIDETELKNEADNVYPEITEKGSIQRAAYIEARKVNIERIAELEKENERLKGNLELVLKLV
jgi:hypothetical protein